MKVALYARVSKDEASIGRNQIQDPTNQLLPMRKFCESMGWHISEEFVDYMSGGVSNRPKFQEMLGRVRQRHFDLILVWALDRFSREGMINTLSYIRQLRQYKTGLKSLQESWLDTSQEGVADLLLAFMSWVAEQEKRRISERTKAALARKKSEGKIFGRPKGWRKSKTDGVSSPSYKEMIKDIKRKEREERKENKGGQEITEQIDQINPNI